MAEPSERRRFSRIPFNAGVDSMSRRGSRAARLVDVSLKGALVEVGEGLDADAATPARSRSGSTAARRDSAWTATVAHREGTRIGIRWHAIDLESIAHLRRLVELNLGGDVRGELAALIGDE